MSVLDRYVLRAWLGAFLASALALLALFTLADLLAHLDDFFEVKDVNRLAFIARYYACRLPAFFVWIAPMVSLSSVMLVLTRFARSNELLPVMAAGRSLRRFLLPAFAGTAAVSGAMFAVDEKLSPKLAEEFRETERLAKGSKDTENVVVTDRVGQDWFAGRYHPAEARMEDVLMVRMGPDFRRVADVRAESGVWRRREKGWLLTRGTETSYDPSSQKRTGRREIPPEGLLVPSDLRPAEIEESNRIFRVSTLSQLERNIANYPLQPFWRVQWHGKWTTPLANLVLVLIGAPLLLRFGVRNVFIGVALSVALGVGFFGVVLAFLDAGNSGRMDAVTAAWFPVALFGSLGIAMLDGMHT